QAGRRRHGRERERGEQQGRLQQKISPGGQSRKACGHGAEPEQQHGQKQGQNQQNQQDAGPAAAQRQGRAEPAQQTQVKCTEQQGEQNDAQRPRGHEKHQGLDKRRGQQKR